MLSTWLITVDVDIDHLAVVVFVKMFYLFPLYSTLRNKWHYSVHIWSVESYSTSLRVEYLQKLFGIFWQKLYLFSQIIYLFIYSITFSNQCGFIDIYYLDYDSVRPSFFMQIISALTFEDSFTLLLCPFNMLHQRKCFCTSLPSGIIRCRGSFYICPALVLKPVICLRSLGFFY